MQPSLIFATAFLVVFTLACIGTVIFQCIPVKAAWDYSLRKNANCYSMDTFRDIALFNGGKLRYPDLRYYAGAN